MTTPRPRAYVAYKKRERRAGRRPLSFAGWDHRLKVRLAAAELVANPNPRYRDFLLPR